MKKRFLSVLTTLVLLAIIGVFAVTGAEALTIGDLNSDGQITAADARLVLRASVGLEQFSEEQNKAADVNRDGTITAADARMVLRASVGLETLHEHAYASSVTKKATCTEKGVKTFTCDCGESYTEEIAATGHTKVAMKAVAATCTKTGLTEGQKCSACGEVFVAQKTTAALGHTGGSATCKTKAKCTRCGEYYGALNASKHEGIVTDKAVAATCKAAGKTEGSHCSACNTVIKKQETVPKTDNHKKSSTPTDKKAATCVADGYTGDYKCTVCGKVLEKGTVISATGKHTMKEYVEKPTCTQGGYTVDKCTVCGHIDAATARDNTSPAGHKWGSSSTVKPTCEEDGYDVKICTECKAEERSNYVDKLGHSYKYKTNKAATCKETGSKTGTCETCGKKVTEVIPLTKCTKTETKKVKGSGDTYCKTVVSCKTCGKTVSEKTSVTSHALNLEYKNKAATCTEPQTLTRTCGYCNYKEENVVVQAALGHTAAISDKQDASCTEDGYAVYSGTCATCNTQLNSEKVILQATGHTAKGNVTCTTAVTCSVCEEILEPALGHNFNVNSKAYGKNITTFYCSRCGEQTDNPLSVFNGIVNSIKSVQYYNQYLNAQPGGNTLLNYIDKTSVDTEYTRFDFGIYTSAIKSLYEEEMAENSDTYSKYVRSYSVKFALPLSEEINKTNAVSQLEQSDIDSIKVEKLTGIKFSEVLSSITPADGDLANAEQVAKLNAIKNVSVNKNVVKVSVNVEDEKYSQIKNLPVDTKTSLQKIYDLDIRDELSEFTGTDKNGNPTITEVDKDDSIGYEVSMTMTLKEITSDALVTYYFDAETYEPIIALYNADIKMDQSIDMKFKISLFSLDGELDPIITTSYLRAYIFPNYIPQ